MSTQHGAAVIVLAAGAGTRMRSNTPKVLHTLGGRSMVEHVIHAAVPLAPEHLVVVLGKDRDQISPVIAEAARQLRFPVNIAVQDQQLGTGHAALCGLAALPADFTGVIVVTAGDIPLLDTGTVSNLIANHRSGVNGTPAAATVLTTTVAEPRGYGRIMRTQDNSVIAIVEETDATPQQQAINEINTGIYAFDISALRNAIGQLSADNTQHELYLTDVISIMRADGLTVQTTHVDDNALVAGVNDRVQLAALGAELNRRIVASHQRAGVSITDSASTWIDIDVVIGGDTVIAPGTQLLDKTRIGSGCDIGPDTTLTNVEVGDNASVVRTHGSDSTIGAGATVGPFTYLRPGTVLGAEGKLGAFVETKNSVIGTGTKVPHLTYVGDASIGDHSNIGASSVFVNYDGLSKNRTTVGSHVRTGSDTMFIAPVTVGDGAYTAAGAIVREDVPPGALVVSAGPQRTIKDWVLRKRPNSDSARAAEQAQHNDSTDQS